MAVAPRQMTCLMTILTPYSFYSEALLQTMTDHTNEYAQMYPSFMMSRAGVWLPTAAAEIMAYIGLYPPRQAHY